MRTTPPTVLVLDDDRAIRMSIAAMLSQRGLKVVAAENLAAARQEIGEGLELALLDCRLPDGSGYELLRELSDSVADVPVIMLTGHGSVADAVSAMKAGAYHYACKPLRLEELGVLVDRALETFRLRRELRTLSSEIGDYTEDQTIVGQSPKIVEVKKLIARIAASPASTVLVTGESGTGKDLVARAIHDQSARSAAPFLTITCSAMPANLLESELFGHERGAFTDAKSRNVGLLERADGGTVFLDEIGDMELGLQAKLLRFLEDKTFRRVGGSTDIKADVRFVAATNVKLREAVSSHLFREDLYYRLAVLNVALPPLREREGDIERLAMFFLERFNQEFSRSVQSIDLAAMELLRTYPWPGNVRELKNAIERAVLLANSDTLARRDFDMLATMSIEEESFRLPSSGIDIRDVERDFVEQALRRTGGNRTRAAKLLGMNRDQIRYRIQQYDLDSEKVETEP